MKRKIRFLADKRLRRTPILGSARGEDTTGPGEMLPVHERDLVFSAGQEIEVEVSGSSPPKIMIDGNDVTDGIGLAGQGYEFVE